jgi:uncharacterized RDD family membrane protein YckC
MPWWLYSALFESSAWQATPGKKLFGLKVTNEQGGRIGLGRASARYCSKLIIQVIPILNLAYLMIAFDPRKQGLHDKIVNTLVITGRYNSLSESPPENSSICW